MKHFIDIRFEFDGVPDETGEVYEHTLTGIILIKSDIDSDQRAEITTGLAQDDYWLVVNNAELLDAMES